MTIHAITTQPNVPHQRLRAVLDGREYELVLRWSMREARWYVDLLSASGTLLVGCVKVVVNWPLFAPYRHVAGMFPGHVVALDERSFAEDPGLDELGDTVELVYLDEAELEELAA